MRVRRSVAGKRREAPAKAWPSWRELNDASRYQRAAAEEVEALLS
jgi:hypothetical protein